MIKRAMLPALILATALVLAACGSSASHPRVASTPAAASPAAPVATSAAASPAPFASWSPVCQRVAADMEAAGYSFTAGTGWSAPDGAITYGGMEKLGSKFSHLSYVEMQGNADAQVANDLGSAGLAVPLHYFPPAAQDNSKFNHVMHETASSGRLGGWDHRYLQPVLNDCANGGG